MIRTSQETPEVLDRNKRKTIRPRWATLRPLIEASLRILERVQGRFRQALLRRASEERVAILESQSTAVITRRPGVNDEPLVLARRKMRSPLRDKPILIVDDEKNIRLTLSRSLEVLGVETEVAEDGAEALVKLGKKEFGLILLDIRMPKADGMEVLRQVKQSKPGIRVIVLTAYGTIELAVEAIKLGADDFIQKPFVPEEIRERVVRVLNRGKIRQSKGDRHCLFN